MNDFNRRIDRLLQVAERAQKEALRRYPFVELRIFSFMEDNAVVVYRPSGTYGGEVKSNIMTIDEAMAKARDYNVPICTNMLFCCEWYHAFYMRNDDYTEEQKAKFKADDITVPAIQKLYGLAEVDDIIDMLAKVPQGLRFR